MGVTIKDIAKETGFSVATVSRVLSNKVGFFSQDTAAVVNAAATKLGYKKNMAATELVTQKSSVIAVIVNSTKTNFSDPIIEGIQQKAAESDKRVIILYAGDHDATSQRRALSTALERPIAGVLLLSVDLFEENLQLLKTAQVPFRFISISFKDSALNYVASDDQQIGYLATKYLIKMGHRCIGLAGIDIESSAHTGKMRLAGYKRALAENNIPLQKNWIQTGNYSYEAGLLAMQNYSNQKCISAVITGSDLVGIGLLNQAAKLHLSIPDDLSLITIDGTYLCRIVQPQLTSVTQDFYHMGYLGAEYLISDQQQNAFTDVKISERESVKKLTL
ncbi:transcriptional regulator [Liquorilactobacillus sucicola DSM 21376 = JCM 15457]|uniref:Transcriptional regulator n=1 Tax=Liquorilactobacillus sucicola DSM 21376 = JCM 15457 TaxID=1423806 RepID=A0A023CX70_9LACO|nr:LacI family DNA-binding transcriptional regulator [Liquorilactobacillus sucicola]KRN06984.1 transcriptional regulator [Liquorilactobacillus sucicola DSM 21376 = JCM 15457]GAJ26467.1 transcriptional regulator [Liquorilactobacillus sucicola DSM 21376 = JCM 15457]